MDNKKISILVPVYNVSKYIEKCAESLFNQSYNNLEFIFVDDCTQDDSIIKLKKICEKYSRLQERIKIIHHEKNRGLAAARNTGVENASGEYLVHVDSDDWLDSKAIEKLYNEAYNKNADVVISDFILEFNKYSKILHNKHFGDKKKYLSSILTRKSLPNIIGMLIKKEVYDSNNLQEIEGLNQGEDYLMTPQIIYYAKKTSKVEEPLYHYNKTNVSSYTANVNINAIENKIEVQNKLINFFSTRNEANEYIEMLQESCIYQKIMLLYCAPLTTYSKIFSLYNNIKWQKFHLKTKHKLLLYFVDLNLEKWVYYIVQVAKKLGA